MKNEFFSTKASELATVSAELRRKLKQTQCVDFRAEHHLHDTIENLQQILCVIWDEFDDDQLTMSWRRLTTKDHPAYD